MVLKRMSEKIVLNVGGKRFTTFAGTLKSVPGTLLSRLEETHPCYDPTNNEYFFDRNPAFFSSILDYYRGGELHFSHCLCGPAIKKELRYWGIDEICISSCCWKAYTAFEDVKNTLEELDKTLNEDKTASDHNLGGVCAAEDTGGSWLSSLRCRLWNFLDKPQSSRAAQIWSITYYGLILLSVASVAMVSHPSFRVPDPGAAPLNDTNPKMVLLQTTRPHPALDYVDAICVCVFTAELLLRFLFCPSKIAFMKSVYNVIDVVCVVPLVVVFVLESAWHDIWRRSNAVVVVAYLSLTSVLRVFRLFKLARHYRGLRILRLAVSSSLRELLLLIMLILMGMLVFSTLIFFVEFPEQDNFPHIPIGFWWSVITMTTVGYGDQAPTSCWGYMVGGVCAISGILITGLPIPIIASNFNHYHEFARLAHKLRIKKQQKKTRSVWKAVAKASVKSARVSARVCRDGSNTRTCVTDHSVGNSSWKQLHGLHGPSTSGGTPRTSRSIVSRNQIMPVMVCEDLCSI